MRVLNYHVRLQEDMAPTWDVMAVTAACPLPLGALDLHLITGPDGPMVMLAELHDKLLSAPSSPASTSKVTALSWVKG